MTKRDIRTRRKLFRQGQIERFQDFKKFERQYMVKKKNQKQRTTIIFIAVLFFIALLIFSALSQPVSQNSIPNERNIHYPIQKL